MELVINNAKVYIMSDIHNDYDSYHKLLDRIHFSYNDYLIIAGDIFDRGDKPVELYFDLKGRKNVFCVQGNHDDWLHNRILSEYQNKDLPFLKYNSFDILRERLTEVDMLNVAQWIDEMPIYIQLTLDGKKYQIAHAQTYPMPCNIFNKRKILMGDMYYEEFLQGKQELKDVISVVGHTPTDNYKIWKSATGNTVRVDCGNGYSDGQLGVIRLNDMTEFYV